MGLISIPVHSILWQRGAGGPLDQREMGLSRCGCSHAVCPLAAAGGSGMNVQVVEGRAQRVVPNWSQGILAGPKLWSAGSPTARALT
jgi:hypothetical protein